MDTPDEIRENRFRDLNPERFQEPPTEMCEMCLCQKEDCRRGCGQRGYVCPDCLKSGEAIETYLCLYSEKEVSDWIESLKIK